MTASAPAVRSTPGSTDTVSPSGAVGIPSAAAGALCANTIRWTCSPIPWPTS